jgi:hypothetical protein
MMDRRRFLGFLGAGVAGVALEQAIPFNRVWSFPKEIALQNVVLAEPCTVRFISAWDPTLRKVINRFDVLYGFGNLEIPHQVENCHLLSLADKSELPAALRMLSKKYLVEELPLTALNQLSSDPNRHVALVCTDD